MIPILSPFLAFCLVLQNPTAAGKGTVLSPAVETALREIDLHRLQAAVAFLASDELEGRDTPSRGLRVAEAYVAARMGAAGLKGMGPGGSFYLETRRGSWKLPREGLVCREVSGPGLPQIGLLDAGEKPFTFRGKLDEQAREAGLRILRAPPTDDLPAAFRGSPFTAGILLRRLRGAAGNARAVICRTPRNHPFVRMAKLLSSRFQMEGGRRTPPALPILLVPDEVELPPVLDLRIPARLRRETVLRNVCGLLEGRDPERKREALVLSAHLDHIGLGTDPKDPIRNGADDDASGVTAVLSLADAFSALPERPRRSLIFVTFWGEEKGLLGSRAFVEDPPWPLERIVADLNLEMLGRPEKGARFQAWMTGWRRSDLGKILAEGAAGIGVRIFEHPRYSSRLFGASDNASFVAKGVLGHSLSAGSLHEDYHGPGDEWTKLDLPHMTKVCQGIFLGVLRIVEDLETPRKR